MVMMQSLKHTDRADAFLRSMLAAAAAATLAAAAAPLLRQERGAKVLRPAEPQLPEVDEGAETAQHVHTGAEHHDTAAEACQTC